MKLNEVSEVDSEDLRIRKLQFKIGKNLIAQVGKTQSTLKRFVLESNRLGTAIRRDIIRSKEFDIDLFDLLFDIETAKSSKEQEKALDKMLKMIKAGKFEVN